MLGLSPDEHAVLERRIAHWSGLLTDLSLNGTDDLIRDFAAALLTVTEGVRARLARHGQRAN